MLWGLGVISNVPLFGQTLLAPGIKAPINLVEMPEFEAVWTIKSGIALICEFSGEPNEFVFC